jgi:hypothetical protein
MRTNVVFLSTQDAIRLYYGSTFLRGQQLSSLLSSRLCDRYSITFATDGSPTDSIVVLTKGWLAGASPELIVELKKNRNILLADPVDLGMCRSELAALAAAIDGFIASSQQQLAVLTKQFPDKPCHLVTHNVDQRLPDFAPPEGELHLAYVGLIKNCRYADSLGRLAEIVETPEVGANDDWMGRLPEFNCHYALRPDESLGFDAFVASQLGRRHDPVAFNPSRNGLFGRPRDFVAVKPFTKGFTAAHCQSPILTDRDEDDAEFYLPEDYPFFLPSTSWEEVSDALRRIREEFGGRSWRYALDVMRDIKDKSSPDHIAGEFRTMLAHYQ